MREARGLQSIFEMSGRRMFRGRNTTGDDLYAYLDAMPANQALTYGRYWQPSRKRFLARIDDERFATSNEAWSSRHKVVSNRPI